MLWRIQDAMTLSNFIIKYTVRFNSKIVTLGIYWVIHYFQSRIRCLSQAGNHKPNVLHLTDMTFFLQMQMMSCSFLSSLSRPVKGQQPVGVSLLCNTLEVRTSVKKWESWVTCLMRSFRLEDQSASLQRALIIQSESFRLEKTLKIINSNHKPNTAKSTTNPCP